MKNKFKNYNNYYRKKKKIIKKKYNKQYNKYKICKTN